MTPLVRAHLLRLLAPALAQLPVPFTRPASAEGKTGSSRFAHRAPGIKLRLEILTKGLSFTGELGWSCVGRMPTVLNPEPPAELVGLPTGLFRITKLWSRSEIWYEIPPAPRPAVRSVRQMVRDWSEGVPLHHAERELPKLADAFVAGLREHGMPYVRRLTES